jgi:hypothetical protein
MMQTTKTFAALVLCGLVAACGPGAQAPTAETAAAAGGAAANPARPAQVNGHPNLNGVWQAMNTAYWNLEGGPMTAIPEYFKLGALFAVPISAKPDSGCEWLLVQELKNQA